MQVKDVTYISPIELEPSKDFADEKQKRIFF